MPDLPAWQQDLEDWCLDDDRDAATRWCTALPALCAHYSVADLMQRLTPLKQHRLADVRARAQLAERRLRGELGLPMQAGAACRTSGDL